MTMMRDVVCGMGVDDSASDSFVKLHQGKKYFFCCPECMTLFAKNPKSYLQRSMESSTAVKDPICSMVIDTMNPPYTSAYGGITVYFCSMTCKMEFDRDPERYR